MWLGGTKTLFGLCGGSGAFAYLLVVARSDACLGLADLHVSADAHLAYIAVMHDVHCDNGANLSAGCTLAAQCVSRTCASCSGGLCEWSFEEVRRLHYCYRCGWKMRSYSCLCVYASFSGLSKGFRCFLFAVFVEEMGEEGGNC